MNKLVIFGLGVAAGYMINKLMDGPGSPVPGGIQNGGVVSGTRWVGVRPYARRVHVAGMVHTVILPPMARVAPSWQPGPSSIGGNLGLM